MNVNIEVGVVIVNGLELEQSQANELRLALNSELGDTDFWGSALENTTRPISVESIGFDISSQNSPRDIAQSISGSIKGIIQNQG